MAGRSGVPARGVAGLGRPLLWHSGRAPRRAAAGRDRARKGGAGKAGSTGPRPNGTRAGRRPSAVRGALARGHRSGTAQPGGPADRGHQDAEPRRDVAARGAGVALSPQVPRRQGGDMRPAATVLVWLALVVGLLQIVICSVLVFSAGWVAPIILILLL